MRSYKNNYSPAVVIDRKIKTNIMKKTLALLALMVCITAAAIAQEKIYLTTQKAPLEGTVTEIGVSEIKYRPSDADQLIMVLDKQEVVKIVFKSGRVQYFTDPMQDFNYYKGQRRNAVKVGLLSPVFGFTDIYLERAVKPGRSTEFQLNAIGLGKNIYYDNMDRNFNSQDIYIDQRGASIGAGIKFVRVPDFNTGNLKLRHIMQGGYIKPAINIGYYQRNFIAYDQFSPNGYKLERKGVFTSNISVTLGKQWILDNSFSIEIYGNLGLGIDNFRKQQQKMLDDNGSPSYLNDMNVPYSNFGYTRFGRDDIGLTLGGGVKIGYLFNWKKPTEAEKAARSAKSGKME